MIDRVLRPVSERRADRFANRRHGWSSRCDVRPVLLIFAAVLNPVGQQFFLLGAKRFFQFRRRHHFFGIVRKNAADHFTFVGMPRSDCAFFQSSVAHIQPQFALARSTVRPVAGKTGIIQNRTNVSVVLNRILRLDSGANRGRQQQDCGLTKTGHE